MIGTHRLFDGQCCIPDMRDAMSKFRACHAAHHKQLVCKGAYVFLLQNKFAIAIKLATDVREIVGESGSGSGTGRKTIIATR